MFDHFSHHHKSVNINHTTEIKRAPTDESVRLLREMEEKAKQEIVKAVAVQNTEFNAVIHTRLDHISWQLLVRVIYSLNGKKLTTDFSTNYDDPKEVWIPKLIDALAKDIACHILSKALTPELLRNI
jgi:hypothetical protein